MAMDVNGKLIKILPQQSGSSGRGNWVKQEFIIETTEQYPKKVCMSLWGDKADLLKNYKLGDELKVSFNVESREYNERWYTDIRAWKIEPAGAAKPSGGKSGGQDYPEPFEQAGEEEDLPF